jgi:hypothetical protein
MLNMRSAFWRSLVSVAIVGPLCACSRTKPQQGKVSQGPESGQAGNITLVPKAQAPQRPSVAKVIVVSFTFTTQGVQPGQVVASFGSPSVPPFGSGDYDLDLLSASGEKLVSYRIPNPRAVIVEHQGVVMQDSTVYAARFPFRANAAAVRVSDTQGKKVAETSVVAAVKEFCGRMKDDPDCRSPEQSQTK